MIANKEWFNKKFVSKINQEFNDLKFKSDDEIRTQIEKTKQRGKKESLEIILPEWFALVREISTRTIGLRHFDTQLLAGFYLHKGKVVEMKTGEGKTLASTLPVSLNAISNQGVHVVTVNEYLAERDQKLMGKVYNNLGLSTGLVKSTSSFDEKKKNYNCDITYLTNSELVFDYLRDNSSDYFENVVQRPLSYCIIDEIDSILIDEARTPLVLSTVDENVNRTKLNVANSITSEFVKNIDFQLDEKTKEISLTEIGYEKAIEKLGKTTLHDEKDPWMLELLNALKARYVFKKDKDYIILENKIYIVDEFTGRIMKDRRWSLGIHEAIETKEKIRIETGTKTKSSITYQNFFTLYPKLAGMTGTAKTDEKEFREIYKLDVMVIPTEKPMIRQDFSDFIYQTERRKWKAVVDKAKDCFERGQPLLIGTANVEKSELLSILLKKENLPHQLLNAKPENVRRESEIIALAGERQAITIATNMAGRGTDIILGGNPTFQTKKKILELLFSNQNDVNQKYDFYLFQIQQEYEKNWKELEKILKNLPDSLEKSSKTVQEFYSFLEREIQPIWKKENEFVKAVGGLFVLGTERHENRRIDDQLRGRAGRQGDPGTSQFYLSLEDNLIQIFAGAKIRNMMNLYEDDTPLQGKFLTNSIRKSQEKVESLNYDIRKNVFQYDEILNFQRQIFFQFREEILRDNLSPDFILRYCEQLLLGKTEHEKKKRRIVAVEKLFGAFSIWFSSKLKTQKNQELESIWISKDLRNSQGYDKNFYKFTYSDILLDIIDLLWTEHLERMNYFRETVNWRSYGQQNPLIEYNLEAVNSFDFMLKEIRLCMIYYFSSPPSILPI